MEHGHAYGLCKKIINTEKRKLSKDELINKFNILLMNDGLTDADYKELIDALNLIED